MIINYYSTNGEHFVLLWVSKFWHLHEQVLALLFVFLQFHCWHGVLQMFKSQQKLPCERDKYYHILAHFHMDLDQKKLHGCSSDEGLLYGLRPFLLSILVLIVYRLPSSTGWTKAPQEINAVTGWWVSIWVAAYHANLSSNVVVWGV